MVGKVVPFLDDPPEKRMFTFADFMRVLNGLLDVVLLLQNSKDLRHSSPFNSKLILSYNTLLERSILFDTQVCSSPVIRIYLHKTFRIVFDQGQYYS